MSSSRHRKTANPLDKLTREQKAEAYLVNLKADIARGYDRFWKSRDLPPPTFNGEWRGPSNRCAGDATASKPDNEGKCSDEP